MLREAMLNEFSARNALEVEWELSKFHRSKGGEGYSKAVALIEKFVGDSKVLRYPAGKVYEGWRVPAGWNLKGGFLKANGAYVVSDLSLSPISAIFMSTSTNGVKKMELVDIGKGESMEDYKGKEIKGKAVLCTGNVSRVYDLAVEKFGAKCVISSFMRFHVSEINRTPELLPEAVNYTSFPPYATKAYGFAVSHRKHQELKRMLKTGKVEIEALIDADRGSDALEVLEVKVNEGKGKPIVLTAHLCHPRPGANDNASGSSLLAEIVRVLKKFDLNREIVALWVPEMYGTIAYLKDHEVDFSFNINLDMVGEDQEKTGSVLQISSTPWSLPSFISSLLYANLNDERFRYFLSPYSGGSDHFIFADATVGVPATSLTQFPDRFYHTSEDTPDKASLASFDWIGRGTLNSICDLICGFSEKARSLTASKIMEEFVRDFQKYKDEDVKKWVIHMAKTKISELKEFMDTKFLDEMLDIFKDTFSVSPTGLRKVLGPVQDSWMNVEDREWYFNVTKKAPVFRDLSYELLNFMELGFDFEVALKLSQAEFEVFGMLEDEARYYVQRLTEEGVM